jgi:hypothetical protein
MYQALGQRYYAKKDYKNTAKAFSLSLQESPDNDELQSLLRRFGGGFDYSENSILKCLEREKKLFKKKLTYK